MEALQPEVASALPNIVITIVPLLLSAAGRVIDTKFYSDLDELFEKIGYGRIRRRLRETLDRKSFSNMYGIITSHLTTLIKEAVKKAESEKAENVIRFITDSLKEIEKGDYPPPEEYKYEMCYYVYTVEDLYMLESIYEEVRKRKRYLKYLYSFASFVSAVIACLLLLKYDPKTLLGIGIYLVLFGLLAVIPSNYYKDLYKDAKSLLEELYENNVRNERDFIEALVNYEQKTKECDTL